MNCDPFKDMLAVSKCFIGDCKRFWENEVQFITSKGTVKSLILMTKFKISIIQCIAITKHKQGHHFHLVVTERSEYG